MKYQPLSFEDISYICKPEDFPFNSTKELEGIEYIIGQERAIDSIELGAKIEKDGYNLFLMGPAGLGKHTFVEDFLKNIKKDKALDWCYLNNFEDPHKPIAVSLPAGKGRELKEDMDELVETLKDTIPALFESDEYNARRKSIENSFNEKSQMMFKALQQKAREKSLGLLRTPQGILFVPLNENGELMKPEEFQRLPIEKREEIEKKIESMQNLLEESMRQIALLRREFFKEIKKLNEEVTNIAVENLIEALKNRFSSYKKILKYLENVKKDVVKNVNDFLYAAEERSQFPFYIQSSFDRYSVNLLVDNSKSIENVIFEDNPSVKNLIGRVEYKLQMGMMITNFTHIKPGSLHKANGGYLIIDAEKILRMPLAWDALKRTLKSKKIKIESPESILGFVSTEILEPEPIEADVKIVLIGQRELYYLLYNLDPEFKTLFKIVADFDETIDDPIKNSLSYAKLLADITRKKDLLPLSRSGVARAIWESVRLSKDRKKLSANIDEISDLLIESDYFARKEAKEIIEESDISKACSAKQKRADRLYSKIKEEIERDILVINTDGAKTGQINGLAVIDLGNISFGKPTRITAHTRVGEKGIIDIEREVELSGPIHSKGVMILSSFISGRYARDFPLALTASLVFEQSYSGVEGDSASLAELCALLSSLAEVPIYQSLAVTGSVSQRGEVQAVGGINEKIESFFDVCFSRGLNGQHGVIIPKANIDNLVLKDEVLEAVKNDKFHIYPVSHVDEAMEILTQKEAGKRGEDGKFPKNTINSKVEEKIIFFAKQSKNFEAEKK